MPQKPSRWNVSPALIAPEAHPLWKGLAFIAPLWGFAGMGALLGPHGGPLAGANLTAGSTLQWRGTPYGLGVGISGASNLLQQDNIEFITTSDGAGAGDFTLLVLANPIAEARSSCGVSQQTTANNRTHLAFNASTATSGLAAVSGSLCFIARDSTTGGLAMTGAVDGLYHLFAGRRRGTDHSIWIDGVNRASASNAVRDIATGTGHFAIGNLAGGTANRIDTTATIVMAAAWNRALTDAEMRLLARDPFCMFRSQAEWSRMWSAGGGAVLNPADLTDGFEYETPVFLQAHQFNPADAFHPVNFETPALGVGGQLNPAKSFLATGFETPGLAQQHLFAAQAMDIAPLFDAATLNMAAPGGPPFRTSLIGNNGRTEKLDAEMRRRQLATSDRSRSITE